MFDAHHQEVERWYRAEQAKLAFKKWVFAAWSGFDVLVLGLEQDRPQYENPNLGQRDLAFQGMLDPADGFSVPGQRPVVPSLALAQAQLSGYSHLQRLQGLGPGVQASTFTVEGLPVYALWYDDGTAQGPEDAPVSVDIQLPVRAPQLTSMTVPTERGQAGPIIETLFPTDGCAIPDAYRDPDHPARGMGGTVPAKNCAAMINLPFYEQQPPSVFPSAAGNPNGVVSHRWQGFLVAPLHRNDKKRKMSSTHQGTGPTCLSERSEESQRHNDETILCQHPASNSGTLASMM